MWVDAISKETLMQFYVRFYFKCFILASYDNTCLDDQDYDDDKSNKIHQKLILNHHKIVKGTIKRISYLFNNKYP